MIRNCVPITVPITVPIRIPITVPISGPIRSAESVSKYLFPSFLVSAMHGAEVETTGCIGTLGGFCASAAHERHIMHALPHHGFSQISLGLFFFFVDTWVQCLFMFEATHFSCLTR
jgi:hypothetical protein